MIKINLVKLGKKGDVLSPVDLSALAGGETSGADQLQKQALQRLFLILIGPIGLYVYYNMIEFPEVNRKITALQGQVNELKAQNAKEAQAVAAEKNYEEEKKKINDKIRVIENLKAGRIIEVKILDTIQKAIPQKLWLSKIEFKGTKITMQGKALDSASVSSFEDVLRSSAFLRDTIVQRVGETMLPRGIAGKEFFLDTTIEPTVKTAGGPSGGK